MAIMIWSDDYSVGVDKLDADHIVLFKSTVIWLFLDAILGAAATSAIRHEVAVAQARRDIPDGGPDLKHRPSETP